MKVRPRFDWRHQYDENRDQVEGDLAATANEGEDLCQQQFAESADINVLVARFGLDKNAVPPMAQDPRFYGDFSDVPDLRTALDLVNDAKNKFMDLPPKLRARFNNEPAQLWDFINDPENADESVRLGLLVRPPEPPEQQPIAGDPPIETQTP